MSILIKVNKLGNKVDKWPTFVSYVMYILLPATLPVSYRRSLQQRGGAW